MNTLGHVNIRTACLNETARFYEALLGLSATPAPTNPGSDRNLWLFDQRGHPCVHLVSVSDGDAAVAVGAIDHIAFDCDDRPSMERYLRDTGIAFTERATAVPGLIQFNLRDPNGIAIELTFGAATVRQKGVS